MRQEERLSQPQGGEGPDDDVAPARLDVVRPPLDVLDLGVPDALLSDRGEVVVEPPVVRVVPTVGAAVVGAAVGQRGEQLRRAVVRGVLQKKSRSLSFSALEMKMNWSPSTRLTKNRPRPSSDFHITCTRARTLPLMTEGIPIYDIRKIEGFFNPLPLSLKCRGIPSSFQSPPNEDFISGSPSLHCMNHEAEGSLKGPLAFSTCAEIDSRRVWTS